MSLSKNPNRKNFDTVIKTGAADQSAFINTSADSDQGTILIVSPLDESRRHLAAAIAIEKTRVVVVDTLEEALEEIGGHNICRLLLDSRCLEWDKVLSHALNNSESDCQLKLFSSVSELLLEYDDSSSGNSMVFTASLRLPVAALAKRLGSTSRELVRVGPYVDRVCRRMNIPEKILLEAVSIAYLIDTMRMLSNSGKPLDRERALFELLSVAGDDCLFPPQAVKIIREMYQPIKGTKYDLEMPSEILAANIVSMVDYYFDTFDVDETLTKNRFHLVKNHLIAHVGNLFFPEVATSFLLLLEDEIDRSSSDRKAPLIILYNESTGKEESVRAQLRKAGFDVISIAEIEELSVQFQRLSPDMLLLILKGANDEALNRIRDIINLGFPVHRIPAFVILDSNSDKNLSEFLKLGIEDVTTSIENLDTVVVKALRIWDARERDSLQRLEVLQEMGTHGSLGDMGVIDLLQAMGLSDKIFRISISAHGRQLVLYLGRNRILHAESDHLAGEEAVFEALKWERGIWSVDPVSPEDVPPDNIQRTIDSILIQGCHLVDQQRRQESTQE